MGGDLGCVCRGGGGIVPVGGREIQPVRGGGGC